MKWKRKEKLWAKWCMVLKAPLEKKGKGKFERERWRREIKVLAVIQVGNRWNERMWMFIHHNSEWEEGEAPFMFHICFWFFGLCLMPCCSSSTSSSIPLQFWNFSLLLSQWSKLNLCVEKMLRMVWTWISSEALVYSIWCSSELKHHTWMKGPWQESHIIGRWHEKHWWNYFSKNDMSSLG